MKSKLFFSLILILGIYGAMYAQKAPDNNLMPMPEKVDFSSGSVSIGPDFKVMIQEGSGNARLQKASVRFLRYLTDKTGVFLKFGYPEFYKEGTLFEEIKGSQNLIIEFEEEAVVALGTDESYSLEINSDGLRIVAKTDIGAMHGLSTLAQLIQVQNGAYAFPFVNIDDKPRFVWRGLMMDVGRHFMPLEVVKRNLDAMAFVKLNVFHWHLSDDQGFRVEVKSLPKLHEEASDGMYYTHEEIKEVVKYADDRGIRVVPEFDVPGHGTAFLTAYPEFASNTNMTYSLERNSGIFDPTLDPTNDNLYNFLDILFKEITPLFPDEYFHIGGDENEGKHWDENPEIQTFMKANKIADNHELQTYFNIKLQKILENYGKKLMGWEEIMTPQMPKTALIHSWRGVNEGMQPGESLVKAVKSGYQTILSNGYYIDLLLSVDEHYLVDPVPSVDLSDAERERILGGEATMWSELVTPLTIDTRIWPRTAAIAERFWSPASVNDLDDMHRRLNKINQMLEGLGIRNLQVKEYLLRNIVNYQNTEALSDLTNISEPYKIYTRNAGGTEYQVYSPFSLFADACTADAADVRPFRAEVDRFLKDNGKTNKDKLVQFFDTWSSIYDRLKDLEAGAPLLESVLPYAKRVRDISQLMLNGLNKGSMSHREFNELEGLIAEEDDPKLNLDVELAVKKDITRLAEFLREK